MPEKDQDNVPELNTTGFSPEFQRTLDEMEFNLSKLPSIQSRLDVLVEDLTNVRERLDNLCVIGERMKMRLAHIDEVRPELHATLERLNRKLDEAEARRAELKRSSGPSDPIGES